jgi:hypothetical protein
MRTCIVFCLLALLLPVAAMAQKKDSAKPAPAAAGSAPLPPVPDSSITALFEKGSNMLWIKRFKGRMDDVFLVDIALGYDGRNCRGYMTYVKSKTRLRLNGKLDNGVINLEERDATNALSGTIQGTFAGSKLEAGWSNAGNTVGGRLEAEEFQTGQSMLTSCAENKWASRYITKYNGGRCDMVLVRMHNGGLEGFLWIEADNGRTYTVKGDMKDNGDYDMEALLPNGKMAALLQGNLKTPQNVTCNWIGNGEKRSFTFTLKDKIVYGCYDYADYKAGYDAIYPRTACIACNTWLDQQVNGWINQCKTYLATQNEPPTPPSRSSLRGSGWADLACWTENIFTGYLTFTESWSEQAAGKAFNFDLKSGKEINVNDLFSKGFNLKNFLEEYVRKESPKMAQFGADVKYREWVSKQGFPLVVIRRDGLELSTVFHPVYGRQRLLVPWSDLKANLKKDSIVADFVK